MADTPPDGPEEWTDEQWTEWLRATETASSGTAEAPTRSGWRPATAGSVLAGAMWGLHEALCGPREDQTFIVSSADNLHDPDWLSMHLDEDPRASWALLHGADREDPSGGRSHGDDGSTADHT